VSGDEIDIVISTLGARGDGGGRDAEGRTLFVAGALAGERVRVVVEDAAGAAPRGRLVEVLEPAPGRAVPDCHHFLDCGGCIAQHMDAGLYENWKRGIVADALARAGVAANVGPLQRVPKASRRRARLFAVRTATGVAVGFQASGSHRVVDMTMCPAVEPALFAFVSPLRAFLVEVLQPAARAEAEAQVVDGALDVVLRLPGPLDRGMRERLVAFGRDAGLARIGWQPLAKGRRAKAEPPETVAAFSAIRAVFGGVAVALPPLAFLQASAAGERALVAAVTASLADGIRVADLYAGAGTFTLPLAKTRHVAAFDGAADLIAALDAAARAGGLGPRVTATARDLERRPLSGRELAAYDAVVFDPPRGGAEAQARELARSDVGTVVAVSCNPATFARDARILIDGGYEIGPVMPIDQFLWTRHVELVAAFRR
jgi:23S rRNA (uracil1939-C5)-methyltransferase